jgi:chorismate mutase
MNATPEQPEHVVKGNLVEDIVALLHATEIPVPGSLPRCIRLGTTKSRAPSGVERVRIGVSIAPSRRCS